MVLALDFDGVISNSLIDGIITAKNAYLRFFPYSKIARDDISSTAAKLRGFVENAGDFFVVMRAIEENKNITSQKEFDEYKKRFGTLLLKTYYDQFYEERMVLQQDIDKWCSLSPPFKPVVEKLRKFDLNKIFIITSKDFKSVRLLLDHYNIPIPNENIFDNRIKCKLEKLKMLNRPLKDIVFVEDLLLNILFIKKNSPVKCYLATWGFNNEEQRKIAEQEGITLLTQDNFFSTLDGI